MSIGGRTWDLARPDIHGLQGTRGANPWTEGWMPEYARDARKTVFGRTKDARDEQTRALNLMREGTQGATAAQQTAALRLARAGNQPVGTGGLGTRNAMLALGQGASQIAGQGAGQAADERAQALAAYTQATGGALRGRLAAEESAMGLRGLGLQEKDTMRQMALAQEAQRLKNEAAIYDAMDQAGDSRMGFYGGLMQAGSSVAQAGSKFLGDYMKPRAGGGSNATAKTSGF